MFNRRIKSVLLVLTLSVSLFSLSACSGETSAETTAESTKPGVTLQKWTSANLEGGIPAPKAGEVLFFKKEDSGDYSIFAYAIEKLSVDEARAYIKLLEDSGVKRTRYTETDEGDYKILNFVGETADGTGVSFSHHKSLKRRQRKH